MSDSDFASTDWIRAAQAMGVSLSESQATQLQDFQALLLKWNRVYNLTAIRSPAEARTHHLLDSLSILPALDAQVLAMASAANGGSVHQGLRLLDVGSGGGLPGVVIAIMRPNIQVRCVDAVGKKAHFISQAAAELGLPQLRGLHSRVEALATGGEAPFQIITSRAFASLADFVTLSRASLAPQGVWLAMKGKRPEAEITELPTDVEAFHVEPLIVPGLEAERCLVSMRVKLGSSEPRLG